MTVPLSDIKTQVLYRCNIENSNFIADEEFLFMINSSAAELYEELVAKHEDYSATEAFFNLDAGVSRYALPSDFYKILALDVSTSDGYASLERWVWNERDRYERAVSTSYPYGLRYKITGQNLDIKPAASAGANSYRLIYVPSYANATALTDNLDTAGNITQQNWHEYVVVDVCIKVQAKQETDASVFMAQKAQLLARIQKHAAQRDEGKPTYMAASDDDAFYQDIPRSRW